ncbi:HEPN-associated N-terminal domain-containing protein [Achromobacter insolitus]|uniref:HEPN-associated N-terminal domain-containing protein n=1 Tax=Achromobacter insolitus TaxID=217204 RepID=UPI0034646842
MDASLDWEARNHRWRFLRWRERGHCWACQQRDAPAAALDLVLDRILEVANSNFRRAVKESPYCSSEGGYPGGRPGIHTT